MKIEIAKGIAALTAEYDLPEFTDDRIAMWMNKLSQFPAGSVTKAVENFISTSKFKPQLADIIERCAVQLDGNWLGADEAWSMMPWSEADSAIMTEEIAQAMAAASPHLECGNRIAARMAFRDAYSRVVERAKIEGRRPVYFPSFGSDANGRLRVLANAVTAGHLQLQQATEALPELAPDLVRMLGIKTHPLLAAPDEKAKAKIQGHIAALRLALKGPSQ